MPIKIKYALLLVSLTLVLSGVSAQTIPAKFSKELLANPANVGKQFERKFNSITVSRFEPDSFSNFAILENGYSKSKIINPSQWPPKEKKYRVSEVQIIYTQYPKDKDFWLTNYNDLLAERLKELFLLDPSLNDSRIEWTMVLQTKCSSESEAEKMFHGIAIYYTPLKEDTVLPKPKLFTKTDSMNYSKGTADIQRFVQDRVFVKERRDADSTAFKVLDRHKEWKNCIVVCDWTASMYAYSSYAALWHSLNYKRSGIRYFSLFNDGGDFPDFLKRTGKVNGVYYSDSYNIKHLVRLYKQVMENGGGGDDPENDMEAILRSIKRFPDAKEVILIADNSCIRDFCLVGKISKPVRVVLCGAKEGINPQYINLAYRTGGSFHTIEEDIENLKKDSGDPQEVKIQDFEFIFDIEKNGYDYKSSRPDVIPDCGTYNSRKRCEY